MVLTPAAAEGVDDAVNRASISSLGTPMRPTSRDTASTWPGGVEHGCQRLRSSQHQTAWSGTVSGRC